ncbi:hypothetical protein [Marinococcus sp. PL1-022]|uniref:hypothetical protein n=1 Tax=Marinococcus sp. PL1-022 TaxID=3095363 RepID=UPI0029C1C2EA|nr:hypothetical protein [Marinococcus sp. PL1-022]MDX6151496.1 hypothetical protein [Marinococcus sp. PL1-022]
MKTQIFLLSFIYRVKIYAGRETPGQGERFSAAGHKEHILVEPMGFVNKKARNFSKSLGFEGGKSLFNSNSFCINTEGI